MFIVNKKFSRAWEPVTEAATGDTFDNLCPAAMPRYNDWKAPTESTTPAA